MLLALYRDRAGKHATFSPFLRGTQNGKHTDAGTNFRTDEFPKGKAWLHSKIIPQAATRFE